MNVTVKVKFGGNKQSVESFGNNRYLVYIYSNKEDEGALDELAALLAKQLGVPLNRVELRRDMGDTKVFWVN